MKSDLKVRIISAVIALIIVIPILLYGGIPFYIGAGIIGLIGLNEMLTLIDKEKKLPLEVKVISMVSFIIFILFGVNKINFELDFRLIVLLLLAILLPLLFYGDNKKYNSTDAFHLIGIVLFLGISFHYLIVFRNINISFMIF